MKGILEAAKAVYTTGLAHESVKFEIAYRWTWVHTLARGKIRKDIPSCNIALRTICNDAKTPETRHITGITDEIGAVRKIAVSAIGPTNTCVPKEKVLSTVNYPA